MEIATVDLDRRLALPGATPGDCFIVWQPAPGHYELAKVAAREARKPTGDELDALRMSAPLTPEIGWEELREHTREA